MVGKFELALLTGETLQSSIELIEDFNSKNHSEEGRYVFTLFNKELRNQVAWLNFLTASSQCCCIPLCS